FLHGRTAAEQVHSAANRSDLSDPPENEPDSGAVHKVCAGKIKDHIPHACFQKHHLTFLTDFFRLTVVDLSRQPNDQTLIFYMTVFHALTPVLFYFSAGTFFLTQRFVMTFSCCHRNSSP